MGPFRMSGDLRLLPGCQLGIGLAQKLVGALLKLGDFIGKVEIASLGKMVQLLDLAFQLADRFLKLKQDNVSVFLWFALPASAHSPNQNAPILFDTLAGGWVGERATTVGTRSRLRQANRSLQSDRLWRQEPPPDGLRRCRSAGHRD